MATLFQIVGNVKALHDLLIECGGELSDDQTEAVIDGWLAETNEALETKADGICWLIREFEGRAGVREQAGKALIASARTDGNKAKRLKDRLKLFLETCGFSKLETEHFKLTIQADGGLVALIVPPGWEAEPASAPEAFQRRLIELDRTAIREAIRNDEETFGAKLAERGTQLRIR